MKGRAMQTKIFAILLATVAACGDDATIDAATDDPTSSSTSGTTGGTTEAGTTTSPGSTSTSTDGSTGESTSTGEEGSTGSTSSTGSTGDDGTSTGACEPTGDPEGCWDGMPGCECWNGACFGIGECGDDDVCHYPDDCEPGTEDCCVLGDEGCGCYFNDCSGGLACIDGVCQDPCAD